LYCARTAIPFENSGREEFFPSGDELPDEDREERFFPSGDELPDEDREERFFPSGDALPDEDREERFFLLLVPGLGDLDLDFELEPFFLGVLLDRLLSSEDCAAQKSATHSGNNELAYHVATPGQSTLHAQRASLASCDFTITPHEPNTPQITTRGCADQSRDSL
jgi:hypothetical protein